MGILLIFSSAGEFGQDIFTLRSSMFEGRPPKSVNMHFRRFRISDIPIDNDKAFDVWLRNRWREKDYLLEHFVKYDRFPEDHEWIIKQKRAKTQRAQTAKFIETHIKSNNIEEFLSIFAPLSSVMTVLFLLNGGGNPSDLLKMVGDTAQQQQLVAILEGGTNEDENSKKKAAKAKSHPAVKSLAALQKAGNIPNPTAAQRNIIQKYITSVRPMVEQQISLPDQSLRLSNAGKGELSLRSNQKPSTLVQKTPLGAAKKAVKTPAATKVSSTAASSTTGKKQPAKLASRRPSVETIGSTISTVPTTVRTDGLSSTRSIAPSSSVSTAPSTKPRTVAAGKAPLKPWVVQEKAPQAANAANKSKPVAQTAATAKTIPASKPVAKKDPPIVKMDKATFDRLRKQNTDGPAAKKPIAAPLANRNVNIDPAVLAKMKANSKPILKSGAAKGADSTPQKTSKSVKIDPAVLAKMKAANK
jgi:hypothetical protein